jgi:hypothetical protein
VAKLDQTGKTIWSRAFELLGSYASAVVTVDAQGNILLGGTFSGTLDLGGPLVSVGTSDMFVAKLDADGHPLWSSRYRGDHEIRVADVAVDAAGNLIAGGMFSGDLDFGLGVLQSGVIEHGFLVKLGPKGKPLWQKDVDSTDTATVTALAVDATGAVTFTGTFRTSVGLGFSSAGFRNSYVARCDADGTLLWARQLGGDEGQMALDVAVDAAGNSVVGGMFGAKLDVGDPTIDLGLVPTMTMCCALACAIRYDSQGKITWGRCFYASPNSLPITYQRMNGVAFGPAGQLWMTGQFTSAINFGGGPLINPTNPYRAFVAELDADGNQLGAAEYGSKKAASGYGSSGDQIVVDPAGRAHVVGTHTGTASFDGGSLASTGDADVFVATVDF